MAFAPDLAVHPTTERLCELFVADPSHGLILYGAQGSGLYTLASAIATSLNRMPGAIAIVKAEESKDIAIEQIRALYHDTRAARSSLLTVIIDDADTMSAPAQNAFLKLLEEPPEHVVFILTSHDPQHLLPTVHSRTAQIEVRPLTPQQSRDFIAAQPIVDTTKQSQLLFLAGGRPAELCRLMANDEYFMQRATAMRQARAVLQGSTYARLIAMKDAMGDRARALELLQTLGSLIIFSSKKSLTKQAAAQMDAISTAIDNLQANANVRLQLLRLALSL